MPRLAFLFRTDTHVSDRSPASWKADYPSEIWSNLEQVGRFAKERDVRAVLDGGDYFHVKAATRNPHALVSRTAEIHRAYPCPVYCVEGNHDIAYNNLESIPKQPLGVLYAAKVFEHLREAVFEDGGMRVRVVGVPYSPFRKLDELKAIQKKPGDDFLIAVVHNLAGADPPPSVEDFFGEPVFRYHDLVTPDGPDVWAFGHWHKDQGIVEIDGKQFVNQGALSRGALIRENTERTPKATLLEVTPSGILTVSLPMVVAPASDVFDVERKEREEREGKEIDNFVATLRASAEYDPSLSIEANVQSLDFARDVRDLALGYLERARAEVG
jgi:DNA repair exonuclease SbcCD nuclease subunit